MTGRFRRSPRGPVSDLPEIPGFLRFELIGAGGFSKVYTAYQERLARTVAVKVVTVDLSPEASRRFEREQQTAGQLDGHPNVIRIYESGFTAQGRPYLVMEHHAEGSLTDRLRRHGPLPVADVLDIGVKLAGALAAAHRRGVVHRDVKPQNVLLSPFAGPVLADFGIAALDPGRFTVTTEAFSVNHAAPEVLAGQPATPSSDLYSLASSLYELLAGRAPFADAERSELLALIGRVQHEPVPPIARPDLPPAAEAVLLGLMARDPADRPLEGVDFAERLREVQRSLGLTITAGEPGSVASGSDFRADDLDPWRPPGRAGDTAEVTPTPVAGRVDAPSSEEDRSFAPPVRPVTVADPTVIPDRIGAGGPVSGGVGDHPVSAPAPPGGDGTIVRAPAAPSAAPALGGTEAAKPRRWMLYGVVAVSVLALGIGFGIFRNRGGDAAVPVPTTTTAPPARYGPCPSDLEQRYAKQAEGLNVDVATSKPPTSVAARAKVSDPSVGVVTWDDVSDGQAVYTVFLQCERSLLPAALVLPGLPPTAEISGLDNSNYCFAVVAMSTSGLSPSEDPPFGTTASGDRVACLDD